MIKNKYVKWGLTAFCTVSAILLFSDTLFGTRVLVRFLKQLSSAAMPVIYGAFMAYLLAPVVDFFEIGPLKAISRRPLSAEKKQQWASKLIRAVSIMLTWVVIGVLFYLLLSVLIPELHKSILQLIANFESYYITISHWIENLLDANPQLESWAAQQLENYYEMLENWVKNDLLPQATALMGVVSGGVVGGVITLVGFFGDLLVGIIVSVYLLATKETCAAHGRKIVHSLLSEKHAYWMLRGTRKVDSIFSGFVRGKLLDSLIIGILCFIGCTALKFPYTPLVSVIVGVTNVIPFFGPFIGAIPSTVLIMIDDPIKGLWFILFVLALQQLDGNVIGPKILGDRTGISSFWVLFSIILCGGLWGFVGMIIAVPLFAVIYDTVRKLVIRGLGKKDQSQLWHQYRADYPDDDPVEAPKAAEEPKE